MGQAVFLLSVALVFWRGSQVSRRIECRWDWLAWKGVVREDGYVGQRQLRAVLCKASQVSCAGSFGIQALPGHVSTNAYPQGQCNPAAT